MDFIQIGHGAIGLGQGDGAGDVGDVAVHGIDALEGHQLGRVRGRVAQQGFKMLKIVVAKHLVLAAAIADAGDHRGVVEFVGKDDQARQDLGQGRQRRLVGHIAGGEQQRRLLAVQAGQLTFKGHVIAGGAGNIARAARAGSRLVDGRMHGLDDHRVLALAQIVVRAPDHHVALAAVGAGPARAGKFAAIALEVGEDAIAPFAPDLFNGVFEGGLIVHAS